MRVIPEKNESTLDIVTRLIDSMPEYLQQEIHKYGPFLPFDRAAWRLHHNGQSDRWKQLYLHCMCFGTRHDKCDVNLQPAPCRARRRNGITLSRQADEIAAFPFRVEIWFPSRNGTQKSAVPRPCRRNDSPGVCLFRIK
jgi:hypothetical protein